MASRLISMRLGDKFLSEIDAFLKTSSIENRTELFKTSARTYMEDVQLKESLKKLKENYGKGKREGIKSPTEEEFEKIRAAVGRKILEEHGLV